MVCFSGFEKLRGVGFERRAECSLIGLRQSSNSRLDLVNDGSRDG